MLDDYSAAMISEYYYFVLCVDDGKFFKVDLHREKNRINKKTKSEKCGGKGVGEKSRGGGERWRWVGGNGN